jgi:hypothetical protein
MKTYNRPTAETICENCNKLFQKALSELKRNNKLGRKNFCSLSCSISHTNRLVKRSVAHLPKGYDRSDEFTPFRYTYRNALRREKHFDISLEYLKEVWEKQKGICPYSGVTLILPKGTRHKVPLQVRASLDRIDSTKGYVIGNVQFVSTLINFMKAEITHDETVDFCLQISKNYCSSYLED